MPDWACRRAEDDLRETQCDNKNNARLLEILKSDIECGWGTASKPKGTALAVMAVTLLISFFIAF